MSEATDPAAAGGMTFDEAEREIAAIKQRSKEARFNLEGMKADTKSAAATAAPQPKSQNIFSHLTSSDAMMDYQIQNARSLVRKQEDLLRLLARMKENLQRSELDIEKCLVSLAPGAMRSGLVESTQPSASASGAAGGIVSKASVAPQYEPSAGVGYGGLPESDLDAELAKLRQRISNILDRSEVARRSELSSSAVSGVEAPYVPSAMASSMSALPSYGLSGNDDPYGYSYSVTYFPDSYYYYPTAGRYSQPRYYPGSGAELGGGRDSYAADWSYSRSLYDEPLSGGASSGDALVSSMYQPRRSNPPQPSAAATK